MVAPAALHLLAETRREALVRSLWRGERSAGELDREHPDVTFGAISQHLAKLRAAGLVSVRREGRRRIYRIEREAFGPLAEALDRMWDEKLARLKDLAERETRRRAGRRRKR